MKVRVEVAGLDDVRASLLRLGKAGLLAAKPVLLEFVKDVARDARELAPVDEGPFGGDLQKSVRASRVTITRRGVISAGVVAGGLALLRLPPERDPGAYAIQQHEDLTLRHKEGGPKFIERPFFRKVTGVPDKILAAIDKVAQESGGPASKATVPALTEDQKATLQLFGLL